MKNPFMFPRGPIPWRSKCAGVLVLLMATFGVAMGDGANPCDTPAGARNPRCADGELKPPGKGLHRGEDPDLDALPNLVTIDPPSPAEGRYEASGAVFGPEPTVAGVDGEVVLVNDGSDIPTEGCEPLIDFPAGAIALIDRGFCTFVEKVENAQSAGAVAVIVVNHVAGDPVTMGGFDPEREAEIVIPSVMVSLDDGDTIEAGLPAAGLVSKNP